ncbi:MAG: Eco57I restriction-modification methylase domain-containing protein [Oscillospiraceae bacterium]|nr:Eco57I restriction-modification methylase domain-containing protein [Oscillospiraceae bacterium]
MLSDPHLKVIKYYQDCTEVFPSTDIKGGIAIVYRNALLNYGEIGEFIPDENIRKLSVRFRKDVDSNLPSVMYGGRSDMKFNDAFLAAYPDSYQMRLKAIQKKHPNVTALSVNEEYEIKSSTFEVLSYVFKESEPDNSDAYYKILGLMNSKRVFRWIEKKYLSPRYADNNIDNFKIFVPESNGSVEFGEVLSTPIVANPGTTSTPTFISIGKFNTCIEAENALKYIKTKLTRALLGIIKKTQHNPASNWAYVPLQDFTSSSDIDWSKSIAEIDEQLYRKYGLSDEEIEFIETHVKEMN